MHHIYTTKAFVVHSSPYGEAGKFLLLFTKDFGMIGATAQGIRLVQSKLRYHVQDYSFNTISIVRGKEVWRLTGASGHENFIKTNILHIKIFKLLKRLLHGEEKNEKLFDIIESLYKNEVTGDNFEIVECLIVLRVLNSLGYIANKEFVRFIDNNNLNNEILEEVKKEKIQILKVINKALNETQL
jgi:recombinational DNA repair protein (RecF pathway)